MLLVFTALSVLPQLAFEISQVSIMGLKFRKARPEAKPEVTKVNVVKRFGAQFRKAFSKKKLVCNFIRVLLYQNGTLT